jgi:hypothetical protein
MIRSRVVSGLLTIIALSFVYVPVATANPIVNYAYREVYGYTYTPTAGYSAPQSVITYDTSGPFVANVADAAADVDASAAYTADQGSSISEFLIEATGSSSTTIATTNGAYATAYTYSIGNLGFTLDGNYNYEYSGALFESAEGDGYGYAYTYLYANTGAFQQVHFSSDGLVPFSDSGTLGAGSYQLYFIAYQYPYSTGVVEHSGWYDVTLSLTPAAVPDGGNTAILFVLGSALVAAFASRVRRNDGWRS